MTIDSIGAAAPGAKGLPVRRIMHSGFSVVDEPTGFGGVVADDGGFFADRARMYRIRPAAPVELAAERAIGVRRRPRPDYSLYTAVRRGDRYVAERQIVELPSFEAWGAIWPDARQTLARAVYEQATSLAYLGVEDEDTLMSIGPEADAFSIAFDVEKPFAITWKGTAHIYYRTAEHVPTEHWICAALVRESMYGALPMLSDRYTKRLMADDAAMARALEARQ